MVRKISLALNGIVVVLSLMLFGYTFVAKGHLVEHTRTFVTEKTLSYSEPIVSFLRAGLDAPLSRKLLSESIRVETAKELAAYDSNPSRYVSLLTSKGASDFGAGRIADFKRKIHSHYQSILDALVRDLRIFSVSNTVAGFAAMCLLLLPNLRNNSKVIAFSFVVFAAVAYSTYSYLEGISFLRILLNSHLGWWYPAGIALTIITLVLDYRLHRLDEERTAP